MNASIPIPFALGVQVWWTGYGHREEIVACPDCNGSGLCTVALDNGESHRVACGACATMIEDIGRGTLIRHVYTYTPRAFTPRRVEVRGAEFSYSESEPDATCYTSVGSDRLRSTREECEALCRELNLKANEDAKEVAFRHLQRNRKGKAASVSYWRKQLATKERECEWMRARLAEQPRKAKS